MSKRPVIRQRLAYEDGKLYNVWEQPSRTAILEDNQRVQREGVRKSDWCRPSMRLSKLDREEMKKSHPDVVRGDKRAIERFLNSSEGRKFRLTPKGRSGNRSVGGI